MADSNVITKIQKAKSALIVDQPFFATLILSTPMIENNDIPTMATDGDCILYNREFTEKLSIEETIFILAHEAMHIVFDHMGRRGNRGPNRWNQAADYVINEILVNDRIGTMPHGALLNPQLTAKAKNTTEGVYNLLPEKNESKKAGQKGGALDHVSDAGSNNGATPTDAATLQEKSAANKIKVIQAKNIAKAQGKLSAGLARLIDELTKSRVDWREVLRNFISEKIKLETTWARPKRRFISDDIYLPSLNGEKLGRITIAIDCSGSVDDDLLKDFASEIQGLRDSLHPSKIDLIYFDSKVCGPVETIDESEELKLEARGGGGTAFSPIFKEIEKLDEMPLCCLVLTDLYCDDFGPAPSYPVLWCLLGNSINEDITVPFGEILEVQNET